MELEKYRFIKRNERLLFIGGDEELFDILSKSENNLHSPRKCYLWERA